jgi:hypothetical protein
MDRDAYLILIGAGISLASSVIVLILNFALTQIAENRKEKREAAKQHSAEIRSALTSPVIIKPPPRVTLGAKSKSVQRKGILERLSGRRVSSRKVALKKSREKSSRVARMIRHNLDKE